MDGTCSEPSPSLPAPSRAGNESTNSSHLDSELESDSDPLLSSKPLEHIKSDFQSHSSPSSVDGLVSYNSLPEWYRDNEFIVAHYRPVSSSVSACLSSLTYVHNETVNIYSHLLPALTTVVGIFIGDGMFTTHFPKAGKTDRLVLAFQLLTISTCMTLSASYHTMMNHSARHSDLWGRLDYCGIMFLILGDFVSGIYVGLYCEARLQKIYWSMITICTGITAFVVLSPAYQSRRYRLLRLSCFTATGFSAFAPIYHALTLFPFAQLNQQSGLSYYLIEGAVVIGAVVVYGTRFPESRWPGKFDILGASHQIFHAMVVVATMIHMAGLKSAFEYNYHTQRCSPAY